MFCCLFCHNILYEPTTLICGHTFCKTCFLEQNERLCKVCKQSHQEDKYPIKLDVLLCGQLQKYFPFAYKASKFRTQGNSMFNEKNYAEAIKFYSKAMEFVPLNNLNMSIESAKEYFEDAVKQEDETCHLHPMWPMVRTKSCFRRGYAMMLAGKYKDALLSFLQCLSLDSDLSSATKILAKVFQNILKPIPASEGLTCSETINKEIESKVYACTASPIASHGFDDLSLAISMSLHQVDCLSSTEFKNFISSEDISQTSEEKGVACEAASETIEFTKNKDTDELCKVYTQRKRRHSEPIIGNLSSPTISVKMKSSKTSLRGEQNVVPDNLLNHSDYDCILCFRLLHEPVTTPCGHTFCKGCLNRCLDHKPQCPLCKDSLTEFLAEKNLSVNILVTKILKQYFEKDVQEREETYVKELTEFRGACSREEKETVIPIFICTISLPSIPCPLYIFEPRYKLMMRKCVESGSKQFGMCIPIQGNGIILNNILIVFYRFSEYGCMLEIQEVLVLCDGRSAIKTIGMRRFKVISRSMRDGYNTGKVQFIKDEELQDDEIDEVTELQQSIYEQAADWFNRQRSRFRSQVIEHYGTMPALPESLQGLSDGPDWIWWIIAITPMFDHEKLQCLSMRTIRERLLFIQRSILQNH
ncbi:LON peptidase N-terminal domain and RING finger protein 1-like [Antedon mediterranea]|uniref:LON peptidase N-terminal domain and RING finger protein 1-like n=1 Tax=Antedon mediterranea TaxID=105859 RepID=UPI003AF81B68